MVFDKILSYTFKKIEKICTTRDVLKSGSVEKSEIIQILFIKFESMIKSCGTRSKDDFYIYFSHHVI